MGWLQSVLAFLNDPQVKVVATFVVTMLWRLRPKLVNEAAAFWTVVVNIVLAIAGYLAGVDTSGPDIQGASVAAYVAAGTAGSFFGGLVHAIVFNGVLPWVLGYGGQRGVGNTFSFMTGRGGGINPNAPTQEKPFQTKAG